MKIAALLLMAGVEFAWTQTGASVSGTVTDAVSHRGLAGALVTTNGTRGLTGSDGSFTLNDVVPEDVNIRVKLQGYRQLETTAKTVPVGLTRLDFELHPLATISGRVVDRKTGATLRRDVLAENVRPLGHGGVSFGADHKDGFQIQSLEPGDYSLQIEPGDPPAIAYAPAPRLAPVTAYTRVKYPATIHLEEGEKRFVEIPVEAAQAYSVSGVVEFPAGIEEGTLSIGYAGGGGASFSHDLGRRREGPFRIDGLVPGRYRILGEIGTESARFYGGVPVSITDHDVEAIRIRLLPGIAITGRFRMAKDDEPLPARLSQYLVVLRHTERDAGPMVQLKLGDDGDFHAVGVRQGDYWAEALELPDGYALSGVLLGAMETEYRALNLSASADLTLVITSKPGAIVGTVRNRQNEPVKDFVVSLRPGFGDQEINRGTLSGEHGEFMFRNLSPGKYSIENGPDFVVRAGETTTVEMVIEAR